MGTAMLTDVTPHPARVFDRARSRLTPARAVAGAVLLVALGSCLATPETVPSDRSSATAPVMTAAQLRPAVEDLRLVPIAPEAARAVNAERPIVADAVVPARPFHLSGTPDMVERATDCLAAAGWYEAGDDAPGQRAVMQVILNRARHPAFRPSVCGVVFQGSERTTGCQFTFTCDGSLERRTPPDAAWQRARKLATAALNGAVDQEVGLATHYHADYVVPYWAASLDKNAQVGAHLFYRWRGYWGTRPAFTRGGEEAEPVVAGLARLSVAHRGGDPLAPIVPGLAEVPAAQAVAALPPPPPIAVAGVRDKSLRGALVRGEAAGSNRYFLQLDAAAFPGNYATAAVALCRGKPDCVVLGWRDVSRMAQGMPLSSPQREALSFYYSQGADGAAHALWNCQQMARSNPAQCLGPGDPA